VSNPVTSKDFPEIRWKGHWIWVPEEKIAPGDLFAGSGAKQEKGETKEPML